MAIIIDGYNLLHVSGVLSRGGSGGALERARRALLNCLAETIPDDERRQTTVVFDAKDAPPGLESATQHKGLAVLYAKQFEEADDLLEELIRQDSAPRRLTVVSSDHRVQRAARRRRATAIDSDQWYAKLMRSRHTAPRRDGSAVSKPELPLSEVEVQHWLDEFGDISVDDLRIQQDSPQNITDPSSGQATSNQHQEGNHMRRPSPDFVNPFPPGYAEDLLEENE